MSMSGGSKNSQSASKRLLHELQTNDEEPNPALLFLRPIRDDELFQWEAVMRGASGTAYEGTTDSG